MGLVLLGDVLANWDQYEMDDEIYLPKGIQPTLEGEAYIFSFDPKRKRSFEGNEYLLGIEQVCEVVEGLEAQLGRATTPKERLRAVLHYALNDAFIDPRDAVGI
jgi:hypothetical protein